MFSLVPRGILKHFYCTKTYKYCNSNIIQNVGCEPCKHPCETYNILLSFFKADQLKKVIK